MLVLTRKPGEQIVIGEGIRVTVVSLGPGRVKIGIEAPPNVRIDRQEIHEKIQIEKERAADVLETVGTTESAGATQPLIVGSDTAKLHNRIADKLPTPADGGPGLSAAETPVNRLARLPRKPR
jgi:carbon storage regulator